MSACSTNIVNIRIKSSLLSQKMQHLYHNVTFELYAGNNHSSGQKLVIAVNSSHDDSVKLPYPERDLFLWCILFGRYKLARVFWNQSSGLAGVFKTDSILLFSDIVF